MTKRKSRMGHGTFSGEPEVVWLTEDGTPDRSVRLLKPLSFTDPKNEEWKAPVDAVVDGASIPRALWTIVGSPYTGDYRRASVVHDVACGEAGGDKKKRRKADRMSHACRAGGCSIWQSIFFYLGVRVGAAAADVPVWQAAIATETAGPRIRRTADEMKLEDDFATDRRTGFEGRGDRRSGEYSKRAPTRRCFSWRDLNQPARGGSDPRNG